MGLFKKTPQELWLKAQRALALGSAKAVDLLIEAGEAGEGLAWEELGKIYRDVAACSYEETHTPDRESFDLAVKFYRRAIDAGFIRAWCNIGDLYVDQDLGLVDEMKALHYYEKGAEEGNDGCQVRMGDIYRKGGCVIRDLQTAFDAYQAAYQDAFDEDGQLGDSYYGLVAYAHMGEMYERGELGEKDPDKAMEIYGDLFCLCGEEIWEDIIPIRDAQLRYLVHTDPDSLTFEQLKTAAANEYDAGNYTLSCQLWDRAEDISTAREYLSPEEETIRRDAMAHCEAQAGRVVCETAEAYIDYALDMDGKGAYEAAFLYFQRAAELGSARGLNAMATAYLNGRGVEQDTEKGRALLLQAAKAGSDRAWSNLGFYYQGGKFGFPQDKSKAADCFQRAAGMGNGIAANALGELYQKGDGVEQDLEKALECYRQAADAGYDRGAYNCAWIYRERYQETKDPADREQMVAYYKKAADHGYVYACEEFGALLLYSGFDIEQDLDSAFRYLEQAARADNANAQSNLAKTYYYADYGRQNFEAAFYWARRAAKAGNMSAQYLYGCLCGSSFVPMGNENEAWKWIEASAAQGYELAAEMLKKRQ